MLQISGTVVQLQVTKIYLLTYHRAYHTHFSKQITAVLSLG